MTAPDSKTIRDLNGTWTVNRSLSDDLSETLGAQGLSWITRKVLTSGGISLTITQNSVASPEPGASVIYQLCQEQTVTPGNFKSEDVYLLDGVERDQRTQAFGALLTSVKFVLIEEARDKELAKRLRDGGVEEVIEEFSTSKRGGWSTLTTWAVENIGGERRFTQSSITEKSGKSVRARLVYDYSG
ncbi:hypothetical protein LY78DRAFT_588372 [Colletotrichum sublineola]|nr:hypothetical protein LY78DRAFT_588372 [Colletotrichum sublineola]